MAEYIKRETLVNNLELLARHEDRFTRSVILGVVATIRAIKAADVAPVRHGHWIEDGDYQICSECGEEHCWDEYRAAYCDSCGAKMGGKDGDA